MLYNFFSLVVLTGDYLAIKSNIISLKLNLHLNYCSNKEKMGKAVIKALLGTVNLVEITYSERV